MSARNASAARKAHAVLRSPISDSNVCEDTWVPLRRALEQVLDSLERANGGRSASGSLAYLSSHPATDERVAWLKAYAK